ncbi:cyclic GMP-AMP synthase isoform X2 [Amblyraja radiata]|uniref:cyclic GMP-AMP synthase isoform X2 n=1 Tax=Amblyraja radiata TaxID=386614 RepID=UPI001402A678|nr:cyclic GMP-AMP synthase isoform X2 [Amblyraja radiata]
MSKKKAAVGAGDLPARATPVWPASCGRTAGGKPKGQRGGGPEARSNLNDAHHSPAHLGEKDGAGHRDRSDGITGIRRCTVVNEAIPTKAARGKEVNARGAAGDKRIDATMVAAGVKGKNANNTADGNDTGARVAAAGKDTDHAKGVVPPAKGKNANKDASGRKTKAAAAAGDGEVGRERDLNKVLRAVIEDLRIRSDERSKASKRVNDVVGHLVRHIREDPIRCFASIETLASGSYYERVKIFEPNEFDIMITVPVERVVCQEVNIEGAFYYIEFKRCPHANPLNRFVCDGLLSAEKMLCHLRKLIIDAVKLLPDSKVKVVRKKPGSPAVTLEIGGDGVLISLDMVLALEVKQRWPPSTDTGLKIEEWLGKKVRTDFRRKSFYLVPKQQPLETTEGAQALSKKGNPV